MGLVLEQILIVLLLLSSVFLIGIPFVKLVRTLVPSRRNPVRVAQERLEQARLEAEAARLNKETEKVYEDLYHDVLDDTETENRRKL